MPTTITSFHTFVAGTKARASYVNTNFSNYRGTLIPISPSAEASTAGVYDLGTTERYWGSLFSNYVKLMANGFTVTLQPNSGQSANRTFELPSGPPAGNYPMIMNTGGTISASLITASELTDGAVTSLKRTINLVSSASSGETSTSSNTYTLMCPVVSITIQRNPVVMCIVPAFVSTIPAMIISESVTSALIEVSDGTSEFGIMQFNGLGAGNGNLRVPFPGVVAIHDFGTATGKTFGAYFKTSGGTFTIGYAKLIVYEL